MKTKMFSILFVVFVTGCLTAGTALANEPTVFRPLNGMSALAAPTLTVTTSGTTVTLSWTSVAGATGYTLFYAPYPYTGPESIRSIKLGAQTSISAHLWEGATFYVAIQAVNNVDSSGYSNIKYFTIDTSTYTNSLGQTFVLLPAGTFTMGSPSEEYGRDNDETQHQVTFTQPFYMQTTEVTQAQWEAVMGSNPSYFSGCPNCPVETVSWDDVQAYITQMNSRGEGTYSLPTEAQWEYAARAGSTTAFANGGITEYSDINKCEYDSNLDSIGWYCYNSDDKTTNPVAEKASNAWGLYDMSGNVWEWCQDFYGKYSSNAVTDPTGPSSGSNRVVRGGDHHNVAWVCRSANRLDYEPSTRRSGIGFRLLRLVIAQDLPVNPTSLSVWTGETGSCIINGGTSPYSASSSDTSVATVSINGNTLTVTAVSAGFATVTVNDSGSATATVSVTVFDGLEINGKWTFTYTIASAHVAHYDIRADGTIYNLDYSFYSPTIGNQGYTVSGNNYEYYVYRGLGSTIDAHFFFNYISQTDKLEGIYIQTDPGGNPYDPSERSFPMTGERYDGSSMPTGRFLEDQAAE